MSPSEAYTQLLRFLQSEMRMSHIYQPVMIRTLLERGGEASRSDIARAFLNEDRSQLEYYETLIGDMPGPVLTRRGIVERAGKGYRLAQAFTGLSDEERQSLIGICNAKLTEYVEKRGAAIWDHRRRSQGYVPGSLRYEVIKRAAGRCEACGISNEEKALEVDHILPRNKGGGDDLENLQALCFTCNAQKRDRDDTHFAQVKASYGQREAGCPFCELPSDRILFTNSLALAFRDAYPVTPLHTLIIPKRHVADYFDLYQPELTAVQALARLVREDALARDRSVEGFNLGVNAGTAAGQTVFHVHLHLIPRRKGDAENPRGGVRAVIPGQADYSARVFSLERDPSNC